MPTYQAPLRDIDFVLNELLDSDQHYAKLEGCEDINQDLVSQILTSAAQFAQDVCSPLNAIGDESGCQFSDGKVTTPPGFKAAYKQYAEQGWQALSVPKENGGQGLPSSIAVATGEIIGAANWALSMYSGLALAPVTCLLAGGTKEQKATFIPKILSGEWAGTMCLTEAHCGSDVGMLRTKAVKQDDGSYTITGNKIFISGGDQDITPDNIIHAILARIEGAPAGNKGISLFIVPKYKLNQDGSQGEFNNVNVGNIEKKMGLKGSATCAMNYDGCQGFLLGEENRGLDIMFKLMNKARLGTALQGLALGDAAAQGALAYAKERLQMRSLTGPKNPQGPADPIIVHPDVRRMLLTQKALNEGSRALIYWLAQQVDLTQMGKDEQDKAAAEDILGLLTPVAKAFCTETGVEVSNLGIQVLGGHGYIREHGMEQIARDIRISTIYEGTTGIQALDLIGRKVMGSGGELLRKFTKMIHVFCQAEAQNPALANYLPQVQTLNSQWGEMTMQIGEKAMQNADEIGAASVDYTLFSGYMALAYMWLRMAKVAQAKIDAGADGEAFYKAKLVTARFYFERILPRASMHAQTALAGAENLMELAEDDFSF